MLPERVGLDIGSGSVRVSLVRDGIPLTVAAQPLPVGVMERGLIRKPEVLSQALMRLWAQAQLPSRKVRLGLINGGATVRTLRLPNPGDDAILEKIVRLNAKSLLEPIDPKSAYLATRVLRQVGTQQEIAVTAAQRDQIEPLLAAIKKAGLEVTGLELSPSSFVRALAPPPDPAIANAVIDVGAEITTVAIADGDEVAFLRVLPVGGNDFTRALITERRSDWLVAEQLKRASGVSSDAPADTTLDIGLWDEARSMMMGVLDNLIQWTSDALSLYSRARDAKTIGSLIITGGGARLHGLSATMCGYLPGSFVPIEPPPRPALAVVPQFATYATALALSAGGGADLLPAGESSKARKRGGGQRTTVERRSSTTIPVPVLACGITLALGAVGGIFLQGKLSAAADAADTEATNYLSVDPTANAPAEVGQANAAAKEARAAQVDWSFLSQADTVLRQQGLSIRGSQTQQQPTQILVTLNLDGPPAGVAAAADALTRDGRVAAKASAGRLVITASKGTR